MATSAVDYRMFIMAGHVVNSRRANLKSSSVTIYFFITVLFKQRTRFSRRTKRIHIFTLRCF